MVAADDARDRYETAARERDSNRLRLADVLPPAQLAALIALQRREIAEARRVQPCQFPYDDAYRAAYRAVLDALVAGAI